MQLGIWLNWDWLNRNRHDAYQLAAFNTITVRTPLTMSTVTSPTLVAPCSLRNALTASISAGILAASTSFKLVFSPDKFRTAVVKTGKVFYNGGKNSN